ncbi:hypothetical protein N338_10792, partial [Podiceps cristatus]
QLAAGHIVPSNSPWNTPISTIPKKNGRWQLLHNLRAVNSVMQDMGALQPGLPSPLMIPQNWQLLIINLKDCFFTIPLHPLDVEHVERFAFLVPSVKAEPAKRYHWVVLPQGMKNSPTMCQIFVDWALQPVRQQFPELLIYHYMDDILIAGKNLDSTTTLNLVKSTLESRGLKIAPEKIQCTEPWQYLGGIISGAAVSPKKVTIKPEIKTLNDAQKLVGDLQWICNVVGITNDDLAPLIQLL